ncbi:MAG: histidine kinase dimerization/phosphoacceptor domain -containing protein [Marinoscillum sp.]
MLILVVQLRVHSQTSRRFVGYPLITNYTSDTYELHPQNWAATQDSLGVMHFANNGGLISFDGTDWKTILMKNYEAIRSFAIHHDGRIFYGSINDFGYLSKNSVGELITHSLTDKLPEEVGEIGALHMTHSVGDYVFFNSVNHLVLYNSSTEDVRVFEDKAFQQSGVFQGAYFINADQSTYRFVNDELVKVNKSPYQPSKRLFIEGEDQLTILSETGITEFSNGNLLTRPSKFSAHIDFPEIAKITRHEDIYLLCTSSNGFMIINENGEELLTLNEESGIETNNVYNHFFDESGNLWLTHDNGISHIEWNSPYSILDSRNGLDNSLVYHHMVGDDLYVGSYTGIYHCKWNTNEKKHFEQLNADSRGYWYITSHGNTVLTGHDGGLSQISNNKLQRIYNSPDVIWAMDFSEDGKSLLTGSSGGNFLQFEKEEDKWRFKSDLTTQRLAADFIVNRYKDEFWMSNSGTGVFNLSLNPDHDSLSIEAYDEDSGLPLKYDNRVFPFDNGALFTTHSGIFYYDSLSGQFLPHRELNEIVENKRVFRLVQGNNGHVWVMYGKDETFFTLLKPQHDGYQRINYPSWKLSTVYSQHITIQDNSILISGKGLMHIDSNVPQKDTVSYNTLITEVELTDSDSVVASTYTEFSKVYQLTPEQNALRFNFSAAFYEDPAHNYFQYRLLGFNDKWTEWETERFKDYTNLSFGDYTFEVRAINIYQNPGKTSRFRFTIETPWYFQVWALVIYGFVLIGIIWIIVKLNASRLRQLNKKLEATITARTQQIHEQKETIEKALLERESLLKEIHHRVKNNLQIIASLLYLQSGKFEDEDFKRVLEEGQGRVRSMALIHQKLYENEDLKSIPFGEYLQELLQEIQASFGRSAEKVRLKIESDQINFDVETAIPLGLIVNELATNAFKYAYKGLDKGTFSIALRNVDDQYILTISDDGRGIPEEVDIRKTKSLGLRLVKMLSQQLEAEYKFESVKGTTFELRFAA